MGGAIMGDYASEKYLEAKNGFQRKLQMDTPGMM
mgnify:CR=1 FL=1